MSIVLSDLLHELLLHLNDASIVNLKVSHSKLNNAIEEVYKNNLFWKQKTEILLETKLGDKKIDWRLIYNKIKSKVDLKRATKEGDLNLVNILIETNFDPSADDNYAIRKASYHGHLNVVNRLLEDDRVDPSANDNYAIRWASNNGHLNVVNRLLEDNRVDPSAN